MDKKTFSILLEKYLRGHISQEEVNTLMDSLEDDDMRQQWEAAITGMLSGASPKRTGISRIQVYAVAATILALVATGLVYFTRVQAPHKQPVVARTTSHPIIPGGNKAILTLADGSRITLDSAGNGAIAHQGNVQVIKLNNGQLAYKNENGATKELLWNNLVTPKGGQFMVILPDGSKVWLNAATSLRYPTAFTGPTREVQLNGEAYFEIARDAGVPFIVRVNNTTVKVLGTHFNIMGYQDEYNTRTTLLEGAVQVEHNNATVRLSPGEQALLRQDQITVKKDVNVEEAIAWKNGYFHFNHESLPGVLRQISRWYDVDIIYEGQVPEREFGGKIERKSSLNDVLKILELSNVHYKVRDRKIIITN
jgi:ferric-dicitrate binding protein FerR (iron transport regulator)